MSILINFRIDEKLKNDMDRVCKSCGMTMSAAFNMFATEMVKRKGFPLSFIENTNSGLSFNALRKNLLGVKKTKNDVKEENILSEGIGKHDEKMAKLIETLESILEELKSEQG